MTDYQKKLLEIEPRKDKMNIKEFIETIIHKHVLIERGLVKEKKDYLREKDLYNTQVEYILKTRSTVYNENISKYNVANYYYHLAKQYNQIAKERKILRNQLWKIVKENIILKSFNKTKLRLYKYIFRGEIIPSPKYVYKTIINNEDLPSYISIVYLDEEINPELKHAYKLLVD